MPTQSRFSLAAGCTLAALALPNSALAQQYVVFAPGTDPAYIDSVMQVVEARNARLGVDRFNAGNRWPVGDQGDPVNVTWSLVPDGTGPLPALSGKPQENPGVSELFFRLDAIFGMRDTWLSIMRDAFELPTDPEDVPGSRNAWGNISGLVFTQVVMPPDNSDPDNPIEFDWDSGATWDDTGSANGVLNPGGGLASDPDVGDIRIAMKVIDGFGGVVGYAFGPGDPDFPGEIVLDSNEEWVRPMFNFRFMRNILYQMVGFAIGLETTCPRTNTRIMEPLDNRSFTGPQLDDIRGVQYLYGDYLEINDDTTTESAVGITVDPRQSLLGQTSEFDNLSIDVGADRDAFALNFVDLGTEFEFDLKVTATPIGSDYDDGPPVMGGCGGADIQTIQAGEIHDLKIGLFDQDLNQVASFSCATELNIPLPTDPFGFVQESAIGNAECIRSIITQPGIYYVVIGADAGNDPDQPQLYSLQITVGNQIFNDGIPFSPLALSRAPAGLGADRLTGVIDPVPDGDPVIRGRRAIVGNVEDQHPSLGHAATEYLPPPNPISQDFPPIRIAWPGNALAPAALNGVSGHATAVVSCAIGNPIGVGSDAFIGVAPEASWFSASVGVRSFGEGGAFITSRESLMYGLFGLTHPDTALALGLPTTVTVLNNSWGAGGDLRGDSQTSQIFDAIVYLTGVPAVASAGNSGAIDQTPQCGGLGGNAPGSLFRGSRTVGFPASAFNTISVGMAGKELPEDTPPLPEFLLPGVQPYNLVADRSSKGPADAFDFDGNSTQFNNRPGVDLVSVGTGYLLLGENPLDLNPPGDQCNYEGHPSVILLSLPSLSLNEPDPDNPLDPERFGATFGTSFAGPTVAGAIALLQDYALSQDPPIQLHPAVIRSILLTGTRKFEGWSNNGNPAEPQDNRDGRNPQDDDDTVNRQTSQALDYAQGAGFADVIRAYEVLRGAYTNPDLDGLVVGAPSTDIPLTDPAVPTINTPPNEEVLITPIPASSSQRAQPDSTDELPLSSIEIADRLRNAREGVPENPVFGIHADFGDPDIGQVGGVKSASGVPFDARTPFKLPPSPNRPGSNIAPDPIEIPPALRIVVNPIGWDHAQLGQRVLRMPPSATFQGGGIRAGYIDYFIAYAFDGMGDYITATLSWLRTVELDVPDFSNIDDPQLGIVETLELENLDLELIQADATGQIIDDHIVLGVIGVDDGGQIWSFSRSTFSNIEHIHTNTPGIAPENDDEIPPSGFYTLRVRWTQGNGVTGQEYDLFRNSIPGLVEYGLSWRVEPSEGSDPDVGGGGGALSTSSPFSRSNQRLRVFQMYVDAFGTTTGDPDFHPAFDINRDGTVDVLDFSPIYRFWWQDR